MKTSAVIDPTGRYRYRLRREWDDTLPTVVFCMLNPSTADASRDDPTIRRCLGFARTWGYGSLEVVNLFAYRATSPDDMRRAPDPVGPDNDHYLLEAATRGEHPLVVAWGDHGSFQDRDRVVLAMLGRAHCLGTTKRGQPKHPLRLPAATRRLWYAP